MNKWSDPKYHILECLRELGAAENHMIQYMNKKNETSLNSILIRIRDFRKKIEGVLLDE